MERCMTYKLSMVLKELNAKTILDDDRDSQRLHICTRRKTRPHYDRSVPRNRSLLAILQCFHSPLSISALFSAHYACVIQPRLCLHCRYLFRGCPLLSRA